MKPAYILYLVLGSAFAYMMISRIDDQGECAAQLSKYEPLLQNISPYAHNNANFIAVEYVATMEACKASPGAVSKPQEIVLKEAARPETKAAGIALLEKRRQERKGGAAKA